MSNTSTAMAGVFTDSRIAGQIIEASKGQIVYETDTVAEHVYYIQSGQVRLYMVGPDGSGRLLEILGPGQWFGVGAIAGAGKYGTRAVAVSVAMLVQARVDTLMALLCENPPQLAEFTRQLADKLISSQEEASRLVFQDCNQRLISALLRFSSSAASTSNGNGVVLHITHDQLAQAIGVARETVSLALTSLRQKNLLSTGRNRLTFDPEVLRALVNGRGTSAVHAEVQNAA